MSQLRKKFKSSPKRFHPKGISVVYEDYEILVVNKRGGLLTVSSEKVKENTAYFRLSDYVKKGNYKSREKIFIVHRLDKDTSGLLVFAKDEKSKFFLQEEWSKFTKKYYAIVHGRMDKKEGEFSSYLKESSALKMYSTKNKEEGKFAQTKYKVLQENRKFSLLEVELLTGRKNQIRVHLSENGHAVVGDKKYGENDKFKNLMLHSSMLTLLHPVTKEEMTFDLNLPFPFSSMMK